MKAFFQALGRAVEGARIWRVVVVLLASLAAGLISDGLRPKERMVFSRPLPVLQSSECER